MLIRSTHTNSLSLVPVHWVRMWVIVSLGAGALWVGPSLPGEEVVALVVPTQHFHLDPGNVHILCGNNVVQYIVVETIQTTDLNIQKSEFVIACSLISPHLLKISSDSTFAMLLPLIFRPEWTF